MEKPTLALGSNTSSPYEKKYDRAFSKIFAGLLISNDEGRRWFKEKYDIELAAHHRQDVNIPMRLSDIVIKAGIARDCIPVDRQQGLPGCDFLVVTQIHYGFWIGDGADWIQEVLKDDVRPVETAHEEEVKRRLESELGIKTFGFNSYFYDDT